MMMKSCLGFIVLSLYAHTIKGEIPDNAYYSMAEILSQKLDNVNGYDFNFNWLDLLSDNVTVCYPFIGIISPEYCIYGYNAVKEWIIISGSGSQTNFTAIEQTGFFISKYLSQKLGIWSYVLSSSYMNTIYGSCVVQFTGIVQFDLDPSNTSSIIKWFEVPDSNRINQTYPCK